MGSKWTKTRKRSRTHARMYVRMHTYTHTHMHIYVRTTRTHAHNYVHADACQTNGLIHAWSSALWFAQAYQEICYCTQEEMYSGMSAVTLYRSLSFAVVDAVFKSRSQAFGRLANHSQNALEMFFTQVEWFRIKLAWYSVFRSWSAANTLVVTVVTSIFELCLKCFRYTAEFGAKHVECTANTPV